MKRHVLRWAAAMAAVTALVGGSAGWAGALEPPAVPPGPAPSDPAPAPDRPMKQIAGCVQTAVLPGSDFRELPTALQMMDMPTAWKESTGAGVVVADHRHRCGPSASAAACDCRRRLCDGPPRGRLI